MNRKLIIAVLAVTVVLVAAASLWASRRSPTPGIDAAAAPLWMLYLSEAHRAQEAGQSRAAVHAADLAWAAALHSRRWEALLAVGDLRIRLGDLPRAPAGTRAAAHAAYLVALERAEAVGSVEGVLRVAEAFAGLGDREVVQGVLRVARNLAARHPQRGTRVDLESERIVTLLPPPSLGDAQPWARTSYDWGRTAR